MRADGRKPQDLRPVRIVPGFVSSAPGSVLIELGRTRVVCTASIEESVPAFLRDTGKGWVTAEYGMLPGASRERIPREAARGRIGGRTHEIQRLIGRSLRAVTRLEALGPRTVWLDCDVIEADGGTRTASVTGGYVAFALAIRHLRETGVIDANPLVGAVAAVSVGIVGGTPMLDLCYAEDAAAEVDMNVVMTNSGRLVEVQGTAEGRPFTAADLGRLTRLAARGIRRLAAVQRDVLRNRR